MARRTKSQDFCTRVWLPSRYARINLSWPAPGKIWALYSHSKKISKEPESRMGSLCTASKSEAASQGWRQSGQVTLPSSGIRSCQSSMQAQWKLSPHDAEQYVNSLTSGLSCSWQMEQVPSVALRRGCRMFRKNCETQMRSSCTVNRSRVGPTSRRTVLRPSLLRC